MTLVLLILLTSELPDPGRLGTITLATTFGACIGALVGRIRRLPPERAADAMRDGMLIGCAVGVLGWLAAFAIYRL